MKNKLILSAFAAVTLVISSPAFSADKETYKSSTMVEKDTDGNYEKKVSEKATDAAGTTTAKEVKAKVDVDNNGDKESTVTTKSSTDPKGLMNKTTVKTEDKVKMKDGKTEAEHKKTVNGKTVEDTESSNPND